MIQTKNDFWKNLILCILGSLVYCLGFLFFIKPANLYTGGFLGVSQLIALIFKNTPLAVFDVEGVLYFLMNIPLMIFGLKRLGKKFMTTSIIAIIAESVFLSIIPTPTIPMISDTLANCVIGGCIEGIGTVISFNAFSAGGGTDILGILLTKKFKFLTAGRVSLGINLIVYIISAFLFSMEVAIFSFVASFFTSFVIDRLHKQNNSVVVNILSTKTKDVENYILTSLNRDATIIKGIGSYSKNEKEMVISVMSAYELSELERNIKKIDEHAFVFVQPNAIVIGEFEKRFSKN